MLLLLERNWNFFFFTISDYSISLLELIVIIKFLLLCCQKISLQEKENYANFEIEIGITWMLIQIRIFCVFSKGFANCSKLELFRFIKMLTWYVSTEWYKTKSEYEILFKFFWIKYFQSIRSISLFIRQNAAFRFHLSISLCSSVDLWDTLEFI